MFIQRSKSRRVMAETDVAPEATDLLFEAEDVADLVAEVTGENVTVEADEDTAEFTIGEGEEAEVITVEAEGDEEVLEACTRISRGRRSVKASTSTSRTRAPRRTVRRSRR